MVNIQNWNEFELAVRHLYLHEPTKTRYEIKHRPCDGDVIIKVTDDVTCLKFRAQNAQHIRRIEGLTACFVAWSVMPLPQSLEDLQDPLARICGNDVTSSSRDKQQDQFKGVNTSQESLPKPVRKKKARAKKA